MKRIFKSCGEFQRFNEGVIYSGAVKANLRFLLR